MWQCKKTGWFVFWVIVVNLFSCNQRLPVVTSNGGMPVLFPDYVNVTIPVNISPLNFSLKDSLPAIALFSCNNKELKVDSKNGIFDIPLKPWRGLLQQAMGDSIHITLYEHQEKGWHCYNSFTIYVADSIDPYLVYRRIAPGYRMWSEMGIYQRNLETFKEETILDNKNTDNNCMNCHSFCMQSPDKMLFHQRSSHAGTYLVAEGKVKKLNPKTEDGTHPLVYPYWHPSGNFIAFSSNKTKQDFHLSSSNRIEVFDLASDIFIYDVKTEELFSTPLLSSNENMETFPAFSVDGKRLYYCSAPALPMPESFSKVKYNLVSIGFNPDTQTFTEEVDTLFNAEREGRSASFPRLSPDGKYLMYTVSDYGNFSIWHKDADLRLENIETHTVDSLPLVNSADVESYHSWSSNSRWFVFSSRRGYGLYTRPYICYINEAGKPGRPFLLPQKNTGYYVRSLFSFNIPELVKGKVNISGYDLLEATLSQ